jgi:signal recognition particle receptor subunit beta
MVSINYAFREICCKIVYYGPGLSGKTTNLIYIHKKAPPKTKGELISLATDADRTLYFDFLPLDIGQVQGFSTKFQLYTVPGQVYYNATRKLVLRGVDGLVFVADSQVAKLEENIESMNNLVENLEEYGYVLEDLPMIMQYNKRDLEEVSTIDELEKALNPRGLPYYEAVASTGEGVFDTLKGISKLVLEKARGKPETEVKPELVSVKKEQIAAAVQPKIYVPPLEERERIEIEPVSRVVQEREVLEEGPVEKYEPVEKAEVEEPIRKMEKEEEIERIEKAKKTIEIKEEERIEKAEEAAEEEEKEKTLIPGQFAVKKEALEAEKIIEKEVLEQPAETAKTEKIKPLLQEKIIISPMLKQKKTKSIWGEFFWRWMGKIVGRR